MSPIIEDFAQNRWHVPANRKFPWGWCFFFVCFLVAGFCSSTICTVGNTFHFDTAPVLGILSKHSERRDRPNIGKAWIMVIDLSSIQLCFFTALEEHVSGLSGTKNLHVCSVSYFSWCLQYSLVDLLTETIQLWRQKHEGVHKEKQANFPKWCHWICTRWHAINAVTHFPVSSVIFVSDWDAQHSADLWYATQRVTPVWPSTWPEIHQTSKCYENCQFHVEHDIQAKESFQSVCVCSCVHVCSCVCVCVSIAQREHRI